MKSGRLPAWATLVALSFLAAYAPNALAQPKTPSPSTGAAKSGTTTSKSATKPTTQSRTDSGLDNLNLDSSGIKASEGSTAMAIRGATAAPPTGSNTPSTFKAGVIRGVVSPDTENARGEHDPSAATPTLAAAGSAQALVPPPGFEYLARMPNAQQITTSAGQSLGQDSIHVALLGQRKYMLGSCLGAKVSVGEFSLKLGSPSIKIENAGVVATYAIDKISFSAFKLRFLPDVTDLNEPCHFSGRFELGGEADDVRVELRYNPLIDVEHCMVGNPGRLDANLDIGHINLGPVPQGIANLENAFKDMVADAMNSTFFAGEEVAGVAGPMAALLEKQTMALDKVLAATCTGLYTQATTAVSNAGAAAVGSAASNASAAAGSAASNASAAATGRAPSNVAAGGPKPLQANACCGVVANSELKGRLGRLVIAFPPAPKSVMARVEVRTAGGSDAGKGATYGDTTLELLPGKYDVTINGVKVPGVTVRSRFDTRVRVGVLHTQGSSRTRFDVFTPGGSEPVRSDYGEAVLGFPAGPIEVAVAGQHEKVVIEEGKVTDF